MVVQSNPKVVATAEFVALPQCTFDPFLARSSLSFGHVETVNRLKY